MSLLMAVALASAGCGLVGGTSRTIVDGTGSSGDAPLVESFPEQSGFPEGSVSWDQAMGHVGTVQTVCGPVASTGNSDNDYFVNLGHAYPDTRRFQFVFWDVGGLPLILPGQNVCATGEVVPYEDVYELELYSTDALVFLNE